MGKNRYINSITPLVILVAILLTIIMYLFGRIQRMEQELQMSDVIIKDIQDTCRMYEWELIELYSLQVNE